MSVACVCFCCMFILLMRDVCGSRSGSNTINSLKFKTKSLARDEQLLTANKGFPACTSQVCTRPSAPGAGGPAGGGRAENQPWLW